jgi:hypothetical protein
MNETQSYEALKQQLAEAQRENEELRRKVHGKKFNWRNFWAVLFLVVGLLAFIPASLLVWANRTITDNQQYVNTVGPIIHQPAVQQAIVKSATTSLYANTDIQQTVTNMLPPQAQPLAGPITTQVKNYINSTVAKIVASDQFANLWVNINRRAQTRFMQIANNSNTSPTVDVNRLYQFVSAQLQDTPLAPLTNKQLPPQIGQITIVTIPALAAIPHFVSTLSSARWIVLGLALILLVAALAVSVDRRRMAVWIGVGWMIVTLLGLIILRITRQVLLGTIQDSTYKSAASDIWHALLTPFYLQTTILFILGLIVALCGWLSGPAVLATRWRTAGLGFLAKTRHSWMPRLDNVPAIQFLRDHHLAALWVLLIATVLALLMLIPLTVPVLLIVLVCSLILWLILEFLVAPSAHDPAK